ncbi:hypothetical protein ABIC86_000089 [Paenibacillus sp. DS2363]|uniref:hypothetical protein n=1 Tax=Paenibacillus sp. DS2363 TaxID=3156427 RepID=UPI003399D0DF
MKKIYIALIALGIIGVWGGSGWAINTWINASYRGTFGDMFGAVNALFSGLAFTGLIYTIAVQRQELQTQSKSIDMQTDELSLQRKAIQMQTEELGLQRKAIEMQTEEIKMQREETARSANQLEGQKNLLNLQTAMSVVNDLIQVKNKRLDEMKRVLPNERTRGSGPIAKLIENDGYGDVFEISENKTYIQSYLNTFFFSLSFIQSYDLQNEQKDILSDLVNMNTSDDELVLIYIAVAQNQHRLMMLKVNGFYPRHQKLTENSTKSSY